MMQKNGLKSILPLKSGGLNLSLESEALQYKYTSDLEIIESTTKDIEFRKWDINKHKERPYLVFGEFNDSDLFSSVSFGGMALLPFGYDQVYNITDISHHESYRGYSTPTHEIGHTLGLMHTHETRGDTASNYDVLFGTGFFTTKSQYNLEDDRELFEMSYNHGGLEPSDPTPSFIATLQTSYGIEVDYNAGNTLYDLEKVDTHENYTTTIHDGGGYDVIKGSADINLREGGDNYIDIENNDSRVRLAYGANIEGAIIREGETGSYTLTGNKLDNYLQAADGDDELIGDAGKDSLIGGDGDDVFDLRVDKEKPNNDQDQIQDLQLGSILVFGDYEDEILVGNDVSKFDINKITETQYTIKFMQDNGSPSLTTDDVHINLDKDNAHQDITDLNIYRVEKSGWKTRLEITNEMIPEDIFSNLKNIVQDHTDQEASIWDVLSISDAELEQNNLNDLLDDIQDSGLAETMKKAGIKEIKIHNEQGIENDYIEAKGQKFVLPLADDVKTETRDI